MWNRINDMLSGSILHPQYFAKRGELYAISYLKKHARGVLLDIGCGRQQYRPQIEPGVKKYLGLDLPKNVSFYKSPYPVELKAGAERVPLPTRSVDTVMMLWVIEHVENPENVIAETSRVLMRGGEFVIYFVENYPAHGYPPNFRRFTLVGMKQLLKHHGLHADRHYSFGTIWEVLATYTNVFLMGLVKRYGLLLLLFFAPPIIVGNCFAYALSRLFPYGYPIGHVVIARRKSAR